MTPPLKLFLTMVEVAFLIIISYELVKFFSKRLIDQFKFIKSKMAQNKEYNRLQKNVEEMKARGELHEWIRTSIPGHGELTVCKKTGYIPSLNGFYPVEIILKQEKSKEIQKKNEEEFVEFKNSKMQEISDRYEIPLSKMEDLMDDIYKIKKDFALQKMDEYLNEIDNIVKETLDESKK